MKRLESLKLDGNPFSIEGEAYNTVIKKLKMKLPCLKILNGVKCSITIIEGSSMLEDNLGRSTTVLSEDTSSCSCLEGNPCVSKYNCKRN